MKIKILNTGQIVDAMVNKEGVANFINEHDKFHFLNDKEYEIIPEPRQPKFQIGDKVTYLPTSMFSTGGYIFEITRIVIDSDCIMYGSDSSSGHMEGELTLHTEPEKPKTEIRYQYIVKKENSQPYIYGVLFLDDEECKKTIGLGYVEWIKRIDTPYEVSI